MTRRNPLWLRILEFLFSLIAGDPCECCGAPKARFVPSREAYLCEDCEP